MGRVQGAAREHRAAAWGWEGPREVLDHRETGRGHAFAALRPRVEATRSTRTVQDPETLQPHAGAGASSPPRNHPPAGHRVACAHPFSGIQQRQQASRLVWLVLGIVVPSMRDASCSCTWSTRQEEWVCLLRHARVFALVSADRSNGLSAQGRGRREVVRPEGGVVQKFVPSSQIRGLLSRRCMQT